MGTSSSFENSAAHTHGSETDKERTQAEEKAEKNGMKDTSTISSTREYDLVNDTPTSLSNNELPKGKNKLMTRYGEPISSSCPNLINKSKF